ANLGICVRIDLTEERQLDFAGEEAVLLSREGTALGLLDVRLREVADEVSGDSDVEQELAGPALLVERERLARARQLGEGDAWRRLGRRRRRRGGRPGWRCGGRRGGEGGAMPGRGPAGASARLSASSSAMTGVASGWDAAVPSAAMRLRSCSSFQIPNSPEACRWGRLAPASTNATRPSSSARARRFAMAPKLHDQRSIAKRDVRT